MPKLLEEQRIIIEKADWDSRTPVHPRKLTRHPGIHVSGVLRVIAESQGLLKVVEEIDQEEKDRLNWFLGMCWEEGCASLYPEINWQPGEIERDGDMDEYRRYMDAVRHRIKGLAGRRTNR